MKAPSLLYYFKPIPTAIILTVALPFLFIGFVELRKAQSLIENFNTALGTVTGTTYLRNVDETGSTNPSWLIHPVVRFTTPQGEEISFTDRVGSNPAEYKVGDKVEVLYNPDHPQEATIKNWMQVWFTPLGITSIGLLLILGLIGWASWHYMRTKQSMQASRKPRRR
ncbi:MAG: DUF3592 domain-containing protein [Chloroflexi bacterium]|nr:DUF3592 domain-containing protein [Chloroflexota bacterium]